MIKVFIVNRNLFSPFVNEFPQAYLNKMGVAITTNPFVANVFMSLSADIRGYRWLKKIFWFRKFIVWTNEPRFSQVEKSFIDNNSATMNVYSKNVFLHNLHFLGSYHYNFEVNLGIDLQLPPVVVLTVEELARKKFCIAVFTYQEPVRSVFFIGEKNIDLYTPRQGLAYFLYRAGKADIVGSNWPSDVQVLESSGFESGNLAVKSEWWDVKIALLKNYKFNICFENTAYPYYCTEKIWHAIAAGCLPIYYGEGNSIYETFPKDSFIDAATFDSNESLLAFLENMTPEEHIARYNICREILLQSCAARLAKLDLKTDIIDQYVDVVHQLTNK